MKSIWSIIISIAVSIPISVLCGILSNSLHAKFFPKNKLSLKHALLIILALFFLTFIAVLSTIPNILDSNDKKLLQKIDFNYLDDPTNHNWRLIEGNPISYTHNFDGYWGNVLKITTTKKYALELNINPEAKFATSIKVLAKLGENIAFYTLVKVQSNNNLTTKEVWLNISDDIGRTQPVSDKEWHIYMKADRMEGGWLLFNIDMKEAVGNTVGKDGWNFIELEKIRIRGNISLAYIEIYE